MPDSTQVLTEVQDGVQTITLNQPERFNALSTVMLQGFGEALRAAERDAAVRAIVLTGAGKAFSSGADLTEFNVSAEPMDAGDYLRLALACDLRYAAESARLVVAFVRIGLVPDAGLMYFLPRLIGPAKTLELAWSGDPIGAAEAYDLGMLNKVLPDDQVLGFTQELAARLGRGPAKAIALMKRGINQAHELPLERVLELEANYQTIASRTADFKEGVSAFRAKRNAKFA